MGIAAAASLALGLGEGAEANQGDVLAFLHALLDGVEGRIQHVLSVNLGDVGSFCDDFDQLSLVHVGDSFFSAPEGDSLFNSRVEQPEFQLLLTT